LLKSQGQMLPAQAQPTVREELQKARFEALRGRIFGELHRASARWRLTWLLPLHVLVVAILIARGECATRACIQCAAVAVVAVLFVARVRHHDHRMLKVVSMPLGILSYFALIATTGGLASPLLVMGALLISAAAITEVRPTWVRPALFVLILGGFGTLAALSRTSVGTLVGGLQPVGGLPTAEYVCITLFAAVFTTVGVYRLGLTITHGYERAALELVERRAELCNENEDRTRQLEGMAARLAHEVKNPLAAIKGLSTHMARNSTDPKAAERLAIVAAEADRLQSIVDGFLSFSRGLDDLNVAPTKPHQVARELAVLLEARAQEAGVALLVEGDEALELDADARKLRQALLNVVLNAIQASPHGAVVSIGVARECGGARITVRDEGAGMTPEVLDRIRKPYFTTKEGGTGLGVAVARGLVEQHGGRLEFTSAPGKGTTVTLRMPAKAASCPLLPNPARSMKAKAEASVTDVSEGEPAVASARSY
jgi:signal transduction histidine kinase